MSKLGWTFSVLLMWVVVSCAGRSIVGIDVAPVQSTAVQTEQITEPLAGSFNVSSLNGQGEFRIIEKSANGKLLVSVVADQPISNTAVLLELTYDASAYNPVVVHLGEKLLGLPDALVLESTRQLGKVGLGVVPISGQPIGFSEGETVAQIMFEPADGSAGGVIRSASDVPASANAVVPLIWDEDEAELRWYLVNPGDHDQNGEVGLSDLMPLAVHFGEAGPFEYTQIQAVVDGNSDGEISIQDITPIAQGFGNTVEGYNLYASADIADIPRGYTEPSVIDPVATFMLAGADNASAVADERLSFSYTPSAEQQELMFWARPFETTATGVVNEGTRSNINGPTISQNPDPDGPDFNFAPVASLSLELLGSSVPLDVLLDGSESHDPDGYIAFYEWDFEGDGLIDAYSTDPVIAHTYNNPGTFSPTLIVTDNHGSSDTFASPPFTATRDEVTNIEPFADLYATEYSGTVPLTVGLIATGSSDVDGYIANYEWDFDGDGSTDLDSGMDPTVMHTYDGHGVFTCRVTVTDNAGASAFAEVEIEVVDNKLPEAVLSVDKAFGYEGMRVTLDASGSTDADGEIVLYEYDFDGDGQYDSYGSGDTTTHIYNSFGVYPATVRVTNDGGGQSVTSFDVRVNELFDSNHPWPAFGRDRRNTHLSPFVGSQTNNLKWSFATGGPVESSPAIGADGTVYVGCNDFKLYALTPDGSLKWSYDTGGPVKSNPAIGEDGTIYVGSHDNNVYAINPDGTGKWSFTTSDQVNSSPAIGADGTVYVGSDDRRLYAINPDGTGKWEHTMGGSMHSSAAIGPDGTVYVGTSSNLLFTHNLYAINPDGTRKWSNYIGGKVNSSPTIGADGTVYVGGEWRPNNMFYAINPDGTIKWSYTVNGWRWSSPAIGADGTVYVGSSDGKLYAINPDGSLKWSYSAIGWMLSSPAIDADGTVYVGSNKLHAINPDGSLKWSYITGNRVESSPAIGADGTVYVGSRDSKLYAISSAVPAADLSASQTFGFVPMDVDFDASGSTTYDGIIVFYEWDFDGDGTYDIGGTDSTATHTYVEGGTFNAKVRVTNSLGAQNTASVSIWVVGPGDWGWQTLNTTGITGANGYTSMAVVNGFPAITYNNVYFELMYVRATDPFGKNWGSPISIDSINGLWGGSYLAVVDGNPAISYMIGGDLMFVRATNADGSNWGSPETLDTGGIISYTTFLATVDGNPAISYFDYANGDLKYVRATNADGSSWGTPQTLDSTGDVGYDTSLAIVDGNPAISYFDDTNEDLKYVRAADATGSSWDTPQTVDATGDVGRDTTLVVVDGKPAISYYDNTNADLKYVRATDVAGSSWGTPQILDSAGDVGVFTSLAIVGGNPAISYHDFVNGNLKYVQATDVAGSSWGTPQILDSAGDVGWHPSLVEVAGNPAISYHDYGNNELKFVRLY